MATDDSPTLTTGPQNMVAMAGDVAPLPALTVLWHPDLDRVGEVAPLTALRDTGSVDLTRLEPPFFVPGSHVDRPIDHQTMNRSPVLRIVAKRGGLELGLGATDKKVEIDGAPLETMRELSHDDLRRGLIITIGSGYAFCLHIIQYPIIRSQDLGFLGSSDAIEEVRRAIVRVPDDETLVLLRGETGTGKELAARALHDSSARSKGPFVAVNAGGLTSSLAASALFGHERGAFTGATDAKRGSFREADGGTLFLDEIGLMPYEVQAHLLRVLQDHTVHSLNSSRAHKVDVRVIAATDLDLEDAVNDGRFMRSLCGRLTNGVTINLPPLRERREDIGLLLVTFLRTRFGSAAELQRIQSSSTYGSPWLSAQTIASIALSALPSNVRDLQGLAKTLRTCIVPGARDTHSVVAERLAILAKLAGSPASAKPSSGQKAPIDIVAALDASGWDRRRAMEHLGVSKSTLWRYLRPHPELVRLLDLSLKYLRRELEACGGEVASLAAKLGIPEALLTRRLTAGR
jgi:two-component system nitrogen regulation response regulator GlnG